MTYHHPLSKAVAFHGLAGVPLVPIQLYEGLLAGAAAAGLSLLPQSWFGSGRPAGLFILLLTLVRTIVLTFRFRPPGAVHASMLLAGLVHLAFAALGSWLVVRSTTAAPPVVAATPSMAAFAGSVALAFTLVLFFFGLHALPTGGPGGQTKGDPS